ncbi:D-alanine--D-alanine ligase [Sediminicola luteus]|uniref:D-alanine--D-alanine ligase n=1 Tax=Sediminicola luteus TaxID=319238 RepID=A0A2A4G677_9FLAO|nr:D-alanine--D-alanine ligase [Sediminicola luteus]PCE63486.1 D-alanine--D-alanine ligase A [Sediminicola luteus]
MKKNVAIIMGGYSTEYDISIKSGSVVYQYLDRNSYNPYKVIIAKEAWYVLLDNGQKVEIDKGDFSAFIHGEKIKFEVVFNAIHGTPGEDGYMQAYLEMLGIPQTACDFYQAALTFNKRDLLSVLKAYGIRSAESVYLNEGDPIDADAILAKVGLPCFVKANRAGSSMGTSKIYKKEELDQALANAFAEDDQVLIEAFLDGTEVSVGVITYKGKTKVLPITEIVPHGDWFDYKAKYEGGSTEYTPARIPQEMTDKISALAQKAYEVLGMKGFSRSEFIIVDGNPFMLEMNTTPGLTEQSLLPQQAAEAGIPLAELFDNALTEALKK